eukprot:1009585_1
MPTTLNVEVTFELLTDNYPGDTSWSLINNSEDGAIVHSGPEDGETYDAESVYSFMWTLNRCNSYTFTIYDSWGDGFYSTGYAELKVEKRQVKQTLGRIDGNFGSESSILIYICDFDLTFSPSSSLMPSPNPSNIRSSTPTLSQSPSVSPHPSLEPSTSTMPTTLNVEVTFELMTDEYPGDTSWSVINNSEDGAIVHSGPEDGETYDAESVYSFMWTLNQCNSYTFTIYDSWEDGFGISAYAEVKTENGKVTETLGKI